MHKIELVALTMPKQRENIFSSVDERTELRQDPQQVADHDERRAEPESDLEAAFIEHVHGTQGEENAAQ